MPLRLIPEIHRATHRIGIYLENIPGLGITQGEAHILSHLAAFGESTISDLHRALAGPTSTVLAAVEGGVLTGTAMVLPPAALLPRSAQSAVLM